MHSLALAVEDVDKGKQIHDMICSSRQVFHVGALSMAQTVLQGLHSLNISLGVYCLQDMHKKVN